MFITALFSLAVAIGAIFWGHYVLYKDPQNVLNRLFMVLCIATGYQAFVEFEMIKANNADTAAFWMNLTFTWTVPLSLVFHFVIIFTDNLKQFKPRLLNFIIYAPAVFFSCYELIAIQWIPKKIKWGWAYVMPQDPIIQFWMISTAVWSVFVIITSFYMCWRCYLATDEYRKKQQAKYIALGTISSASYVIFLFVIQELNPDSLIVSFPADLALSLFIGYAMVKYKLFIVGPESVARDVVSAMSDFLFLVNGDGRIFFVNQAVLNNFEYEEAALLGKPINMIVRKEDEKRLLAEIDNIQNGTTTASKILETNLRTRSGQKIPTSLSLSFVKDKANKLQGIVCICRDVTELKRTEKKLIHAKEAAETANIAKSEFLSNMSHELRTPLNHIIGFTELILDKHLGPLNNDQQEYLTDVHTSSNHLLCLINDILDLSKIESGKFELQLADVNLKEVLENSLIIIKDKALKHDLRLSLSCASISEIIRTDERKLKQILYNLLSNAVKFTPDNGKICLAANKVSGTDLSLSGFSPNPAEEFIEISVVDSGIGINPEDLERIFNSFEQVENSARRKYQGTGLGLSLTNKFVEILGGRIWAESEGKNKGSKFNLIIPASPSAKKS